MKFRDYINEYVVRHIETRSPLQQQFDDIRLRLGSTDPDDPEAKFMRAELRQLKKMMKTEKPARKK